MLIVPPGGVNFVAWTDHIFSVIEGVRIAMFHEEQNLIDLHYSVGC